MPPDGGSFGRECAKSVLWQDARLRTFSPTPRSLYTTDRERRPYHLIMKRRRAVLYVHGGRLRLGPIPAEGGSLSYRRLAAYAGSS